MRPTNLIVLLSALITLMPQPDALAATGGWIEQNVGQADVGIDAIARANQVTLLLNPDRARILLPSMSQISIEPDAGSDIHASIHASVSKRRSRSLELVLHGANSDAVMHMGQNHNGISRYFRGQNPDDWLGNVAHYNSVSFSEVYPGIDLVYRFNGTQLEYDFEVAADANVSDIQLELLGAERVEIDTNGDWVAWTAVGEFRQRAPEIFRVTEAGLDPIAGGFLSDDNQKMSFQLAAPADAVALLIDPVIEFSGYIGGSGQDRARSIAMNLRDNLIVSGITTSTDIPGSPPGIVLGGQDIYIAEIDTGTGELLWIDYIGGSGSDWSDKIELDSLGNIIAVGYTDSADFPAVNAFQSTYVGNEDPASLSFNWDAIVFKLNDDGSAFDFSTYYGGADWTIDKLGFEWFRGIAIDDDDNIYAAGQTGAPDFPVTDVFLGRSCMATDDLAVASFVSDITLVKFAPDGTRLFATCIGGTERDGGRSVVLGDDGRVYLGGFGRSSDLPTSTTAFQPVPLTPLNYSAFVLKLNETLTDIDWGTYVGGSSLELMQEIQVDSSGSVYGSGSTYSFDYPFTVNALQTVLNGGAPTPDPDFTSDGFVFKLLPDGTDLSYSSYFGGGNLDDITATFIDSAGRLYVAGTTWSRDMLLETPLQPGPGPLYSRVDTLSATGSQIQGLAKNIYFNSVGSGVSAALVARNGVNQVHFEESPGNWIAEDIGTASENTTAVIGRTNQSAYFINSMAPNRVYQLDFQAAYMETSQFGDVSKDSRAASTINVAGGVFLDIVVANFADQNEIYVDAGGTAVPIGRSDGRTVAVATGNFGGDSNDIVFANDNQDVRLYRSQGLAVFDAPVILSTTSAAVTSLAAGDIDGDNWDDLIIGNDGAPVQIIRFSGGTPDPVVELAGGAMTTQALLLADVDGDTDLDLFIGNNDFDKLYINDGSGGFTQVAGFPSNNTPTYAISAEEDCFNCISPIFGGTGDLQQYVLANYDIFVAVIDPDIGTLEFSTYLDGGGSESIFRGMTLVEPGKILIHGTTDSDSWPVVGAAQSTPGGGADGIFMVINVDVDGDGILDGRDNCLNVANPGQRDTDNDAYGNFCDPDLNNDDFVNFLDLQIMQSLFFSSDPNADLNGDGIVNFMDLTIMRSFFFGPPGPSGLLLD